MRIQVKKFSKVLLILSVVAGVLALGMSDTFAKEARLPKAGTGAAAGEAATAAVAVDLNTADQKALESLPGVGPATAKEIIKGRPYSSVDDLARIKGMSKGKIDKLRGMATVSQPKAVKPSVPLSKAAPVPAAPAATKPSKSESPAQKIPLGMEKKAMPKAVPGGKVNINTASKEMLEALPGIGPAKAQAIIEGRPYGTPEDIMKVKGIKQGTFDKIKDQITVR